jgi:hypothetical protein
VVLERVDDDKIPEAVTNTSDHFFDPPNDLEVRADELAKAISADIAWWHEHGVLMDRAEHWEHGRRPKGQLSPC